jgi:hypothetical protein
LGFVFALAIRAVIAVSDRLYHRAFARCQVDRPSEAVGEARGVFFIDS